jgi:hypothetical protein
VSNNASQVCRNNCFLVVQRHVLLSVEPSLVVALRHNLNPISLIHVMGMDYGIYTEFGLGWDSDA